jgi:phage portal protein BeeE
MGNPWVGGAVKAISGPIESSDIIAVPTADEVKPNEVMIDYMEDLLLYPNPTPNANFFKEQLVEDKKIAGAYYVEVNYNAAGFPARFDRISPAQIQIKQKGGVGFYIKDNGYVFPPESLIVGMEPNPLDNYRGLTPLVKLFDHMMLDEALTEHNLRFFTKDMLKGIINMDPKVHTNTKSAQAEAIRINQDLSSMEEKGESGHLLVYGATYQSLNTSNRDMLTPSITENIIQAVKTVYRVPPSKMMQAIPGSLGGQDETQDDSMNETLMDEISKFLKPFNYFFANVMGITDTTLSYDNLTNTDQTRQANLDNISLMNSSTSIDEVRTNRGDTPYGEDWSKYPLLNKNMMPLSWALNDYSNPGDAQASNNPASEAAYDQQTILEDKIRERVRDLIRG